MVTLCLLLAVLALVISLPLTWGVIRAGYRLGQVDRPEDPAAGGRKWHGRVVPNTGGIAIFWALAGPMAAGLLLVWLAPALVRQAWPAAAPHLPGLKQETPLALAMLGGMAVLHVLGLVDDRRRLGPFVKLGVQVLVALALAVFFEVRVLEFLGHWYGRAGAAISVVLTVLWILTITNAMNFLDNMDGLSGGIGALIAGLYLAANLVGGQWFVAAVAALLLGALLGFLVFNFPPARVFMGDGGSLVLGYTLALISIRTTYVGEPSPQAVTGPGHWYGVLMPLVVMAVPLYDITSVTLIRLKHGRSPFVGDRNHFSHRLVRMGLSQRGAVIVIWACTLATGLGGVMLRTLNLWQAVLVAGQTGAVLLTLAVVERSGSK